MASKPSIVELDNFVKILFSGNKIPASGREEDVLVLSTNSDGTRRTVWGPVFFHPTESVVYTYHSDKPQRRLITGPFVPSIPLSAIYCKAWVKDERWHNPVIRIKAPLQPYLGISEPNATFIGVFCFDTYYDNAGVCHWIIDTFYVDIIGMENLVLASEDGIWCLTYEEARRWVEVIVGSASCNQVEENEVGLNLPTDSTIPLKSGPPRTKPRVLVGYQDLMVEAIKGTSYTVTKPMPCNPITYKIVVIIEKVVNNRSHNCGKAFQMNILFRLEVEGNVRKVIIMDDSFAEV